MLDGEDPADVEHELYDLSHRPYNTGFFFSEAEQAVDYDGYEQECLHVADVVGCEPLGPGAPGSPCGPAQGRYRILARCRNRWSEGDGLEALVPRAPVRDLVVRNLLWHPEEVDGEGGPVRLVEPGGLGSPGADVAPDGASGIQLGADFGASLGLGAPEPVAVANRSVALYSFEADAPVPAGSYLRVRAFRRSARHE